MAVLEQGLGQGLYAFAFLADGGDRERFRALLQVAPRPDLVVFVQAPADVVRERIRGRSNTDDPFEPRLLSDGPWMAKATSIFAGIADAFDQEGVRVVRCDTHALSIPVAADAIIAEIRSQLALLAPASSEQAL